MGSSGTVPKLCLSDYCPPGEEAHFHLALAEGFAEPHTHDFFEIELVVEGKLCIEVNGLVKILPKNGLMFTRPEDIHCLRSADQSPCRFMNLAFSPVLMRDLDGFLGKSASFEHLMKSPVSPMAMPDPYTAQTLRHRMEGLAAVPAGDRERYRCALRLLIACVMVDGFLVKRPADGCPAWMNRLLQDMQRQPFLREGMTALQRLSGVHPDSVSRAFKRCLGITPTAWLQETRLNWFANRLAHSDESIAELALDAGFENLSHCYHLFRTRFSCTPGQHRKMNRIRPAGG